MQIFIFESIPSLRILNIAFHFVLFTSVSLKNFVSLKMQENFYNKFQIPLRKYSIITTQTSNISVQLEFSFYLHTLKRQINCALHLKVLKNKLHKLYFQKQLKR